MSQADSAFVSTCRAILEHGSLSGGEDERAHWADGTPAHTRRLFGVVNRYDLRADFPLLTLRPISLTLAVDEVLWIWQRKSNNVRDLRSHIWDAWADENGCIGKAYGYQMGVRHRYPEGEFDQTDRVLFELRHNPSSRRILTNLYNFEDLHEMRLYPCAYSMTFHVQDGVLSAILNQRSQDMLAANAWNVAQYAALLMMLAQVSGLVAGELLHVIADAHIYDRHIPIVEELLTRESYPAPRVTLDPSVSDFYAFTPESFTVENYRHGEKIPRFEVAV